MNTLTASPYRTVSSLNSVPAAEFDREGKFNGTVANSASDHPSILQSGGTRTSQYAVKFAAGLIAGPVAAAGFIGKGEALLPATNPSGPNSALSLDEFSACPTIIIQPATLPNALVGVPFSQTLIASGGASPYSFAAAPGALPTWLSLSSNGTLSGSPTATGLFSFTVTATDANNCTGTMQYTMSINCPAISLSPDTLPNGVVGAAYSQSISISGSTSFTFSVPPGGMPPGLTLSPTGTVSGTPTAAGTFPFTVTATGPNNCGGSKIYTLIVTTAVCSPVTLSPGTLPGGVVGTAYNQAITASGSSTYTFSITVGSVPQGLALTPFGALIGTPTKPGASSFTVTATAANGCTGTNAYTINVNPSGCPAVTFLPTALPAGTVDTPYNQNISASGDPLPSTYSVTAGALPSGLTLFPVGALTGIPTTAGTFSFTVTLTDINGCAASQNYSLTISGSTNSHFQLDLFLPQGGAATTSTIGSSGIVQAGYATVTMNSGVSTDGTAVFSSSSNGLVVTEAGVPASPPTTHAKIFIDFRSGVPAKAARLNTGTININTGFALVNRGAGPAHVTYTLRDSTGATLIATGSSTLVKDAHDARFIDQIQQIAPSFAVPGNFSTTTQFGSLEIQSDQPLSILALRLTGNQRGDTLLTTTPIADLAKPLSSNALYFPQVVDGGGYQTTFILLNTSVGTETGALSLFNDSGLPLSVKQVGGASTSSFRYSIPPGGVFLLETDGSPVNVGAGSVQVIPDQGTSSPVGAGVFRFTQNGIVVTESGIPAANPTTHARIYVDKSGGHDTGLALAAPNSDPVSVVVSAFQSDGKTALGTSAGPVPLSGKGHTAKFVGEMVSGLPSGFTGVLDITSASPFVALTLRLLDNRRDTLLTTFPIADYSQPAVAPLVFPHIVDGGGYLTQFILLDTGVAANTTLSFFGDSGSPLAVGKSVRR
ncbi:MAG: Ig domain-containing protein [Acidobacteriia bacterium]|nr:Ig domain-containing protein [Terriglobia bacterium]